MICQLGHVGCYVVRPGAFRLQNIRDEIRICLRVAATSGSMACVVTSDVDVMCLIAAVFSLVIHSDLQRHYLCGCSIRSRHRIVDIASIADTAH